MQDRRNSKSGNDRAERILDAAAQVFLAHGYAGTSIDAIIALAGGSKRTIYELFGGKDELFRALVEREIEIVVATLNGADLAGRKLHETLELFGQTAIEIMYSERVMGLMRLVAAETRTHPRLATLFYEAATARLTRELAQLLAKAPHSVPPDPYRVADQFISLLRGDLFLRLLLGIRESATPQEKHDTVTRAVALFLHGAKTRGT